MKMNNETISGIVADLKVIPTQTGKSMVTFVIGDKCCKAFGDVAATLQTLNEEQVLITAKPGKYRGKPEYAVVSVKGTVDGQSHTATDIRRNTPVRAASGACPRSGAQVPPGDFYPGLTGEQHEKMMRSGTRKLSEEELQKAHETMTASWVKSFSDIFRHPNSDLEKRATSTGKATWIAEAARRVLDTRKAGRIAAQKAAREMEELKQQESHLNNRSLSPA
jgi:hypothetical protein